MGRDKAEQKQGGGGSVTDAGKLMQICLRHNVTKYEDLDAYHVDVKTDGTRRVPEFDGPIVRQIAIPTTLSGGEFQPGGGCTDNRNKVKRSYRHPLLIPRVTILDPAPTVHTPMWVWLSTGVRAVDHPLAFRRRGGAPAGSRGPRRPTTGRARC